MEVLRLEDVRCIYGKNTPFEIAALDGVTVGFEKGSVTGVIGHTGSGKSTLVQMLNGLLKPTEGRVLFEGKDVWENKKEIGRLRFRVGLVMQYPEYQLFDETVEADIAYGPRNMGLSEEEIAGRVKEAAAFVGLPDELMKKSPLELSGGQKRRAAIAGVIAMRPEVLVLDEPAAGMTPHETEDLVKTIHFIRDHFDMTILLIEHDMKFIAGLCDSVTVLNFGTVLAEGDTRTALHDPEVIKAYIGG